MELTEKVAYLKGFIEGIGLDENTQNGKVIGLVVDILEDLVDTVSDVEDEMEAISDQVDAIDDDLSELYEDMYGDDDDDMFEDFDGEMYEVTCPTCNETICVDEDMLDEGEIDCPSCGETLEFDLDGVLDDCGCDCHSPDHEHKKKENDK